MRNNLKSKSSIANTYLELDIINKFESLEEYPGTKPILLVTTKGNIIYSNNTAKQFYGLSEVNNLFDLKTEPNLTKLFEHLSKNDIPSFYSDLLLERDQEYYEGYFLNIERVYINNEEIFIVYLDSQDNRKKLTKKVNTYNQALESVSVGVLIADYKAEVKYLSTTFEKFLNVRIEKIYNQNLVYAFKKYLSEFELNELDLAIIEKRNWVKVISDINNEGDVRYKEIRLNVTTDTTDNSINYIVTANDITKHIQQARLIKKSEQRQKSIINNISDPILILRREKTELIFENANNTFYNEILGKKVESQEETMFELVNPVLHSIVHEAIFNNRR